MRSGLLSDLVNIGYEIFLEGNNVRYRYQKPGNPPDTVKPLIDELKKYKAEVVNILKGGNALTPTETPPSHVNVKISWPPEIQSLIDWFITLEPPAEPFYLESHRHIVAPSKFFASLQRDIHTGPRGPRARMGTLQSDLWNLKAYLN